jgi:hypothetical protein
MMLPYVGTEVNPTDALLVLGTSLPERWDGIWMNRLYQIGSGAFRLL